MRYMIIFIMLMISGCTFKMETKIGDCFISADFSKLYKITKLGDYGLYADPIDTVWETVDSKYALYEIAAVNYHRLDCSVFEKYSVNIVKKSKDKQ